MNGGEERGGDGLAGFLLNGGGVDYAGALRFGHFDGLLILGSGGDVRLFRRFDRLDRRKIWIGTRSGLGVRR